ncbi:MAG: tRNA-dihydrouridine synthase family protein [Parasporobacterium sp.]|nr:tRNA-dihydrouridine synthase family protein [Parasporobacterium sp.]MBQ9033025.1 tRNA-dihydrouridine synthase family protein [Parasporobacterium sp.]
MQIYLAPMEGITGYIVRNAFFHHFGQIDKYFTPFIPAAKRFSRKILRDLDPANNAGIRLVPQLISNRSEEVLIMIGKLKDLGFGEINLNLGCPSGTVISKSRGSGLLRDPQALDRFLYGIYEKADVPVSVKTRIGFDSLEEWPEILEIFLKYPISELIIHPRLRREMYTGYPHLEAYQLAYDRCNTVAEPSAVSRNQNSGSDQKTPGISPASLVYNGDLWDSACCRTLLKRFPETGTVMIGRGLLARPDLACTIKQIPVEDLRGKLRRFHDEIYDGYLETFTGDKDVFMHMKEIWANLGKSFHGSDRLLKKLMKSQSASEYRIFVDQIFETLELSER